MWGKLDRRGVVWNEKMPADLRFRVLKLEKVEHVDRRIRTTNQGDRSL